MSFEAPNGTTIAITGVTAVMSLTAGIDNVSPGLQVESNSESYFGIAVGPSVGSSGEGFIELDGIGTGNYPYFESFFANGVVGTLTAVKSGDVIYQQNVEGLANVTASGYGLIVTAAEDWSSGHNSATVELRNAATGGPILTRIELDASGHTRVQNGALALDKAYTVAALPGSPTLGMQAVVSDALAPAWGVTVSAGGSAKALVWYNGSAWTVVGK
jgi:hypothetical protein